jgi:hypothetical protein
MKPLTAQQIADAAAKRAASVAARKASGGMTVRQQRAAAKAAKAGQPFTPPPPPAPKAPRAPRARFGRRRGFGRHVSHVSTPTPTGPVFSTPKPALRPLRLAALVALEDVFKQKCMDQPTTVTEDVRSAFKQYQKVKNRALAPSTDVAMQNEADTALRVATLNLVKLAF